VRLVPISVKRISFLSPVSKGKTKRKLWLAKVGFSLKMLLIKASLHWRSFQRK